MDRDSKIDEIFKAMAIASVIAFLAVLLILGKQMGTEQDMVTFSVTNPGKEVSTFYVTYEGETKEVVLAGNFTMEVEFQE